jgi:hypothetical protein
VDWLVHCSDLLLVDVTDETLVNKTVAQKDNSMVES